MKGDIHRPSGFVQVAGGKGLNVARAARSLGADACAVALLRGHNGRWLQEALAAEGVEGEFVWTHGENRSSLSVADRETAGLTEFYEHGAVAPDAAWVELTHATASRWAAGGWLTISGSMPRGAPDEGYRDLIEEARRAGVRVALDSEGERLRVALTAQPEVVKLNVAEAGQLLGVPTARRDDSLAAASKIRAMAGGEGHAGIVTRGAEGVMLAAPDGTLYEGVLYVRGRYPVGSGDSFLAGLVTALERGERLGRRAPPRARRGRGQRRARRRREAGPLPRRGARGTGRRASALGHRDDERGAAGRGRLGRLPRDPVAFAPGQSGCVRLDVRRGVVAGRACVARLGRGTVARR